MTDFEYRALSQRVLAVAVEGGIGDWSAYIDAVQGINHSQEQHKVREEGSKLPKKVAEALFPLWAHKFTWRE